MSISIVYAPISCATNFGDDLFSQDELAKENRYHKIEDRHRHRAAHGIKRILLSKLTGQPANQLAFYLGQFGKPYLKTSPNIQFNLSHSGNWVALAFSQNPSINDIGIDIESINNSLNTTQIKPELIHPNDPEILTKQDFYCHWVIKESVAKTTGEGINIDFKNIHIKAISNTLFEVQIQQKKYYGWQSQLPDNTAIAVSHTHTKLNKSHYQLMVYTQDLQI